jgi:phage shock protein PspC (stress-responsive transcriptional regulator)
MNKIPLTESFRVAEYNSRLYDLTYKDDDFSSYTSRTLNPIGEPPKENDKYKKKEEGFPIEIKPNTKTICGIHDIFDMQCYKEFKIVLWILIALIFIIVLCMIWYIIQYVIVPNAGTPPSDTQKESLYSRIFDKSKTKS